MEKNTKILYLNRIRILASLFVVVIHVCAKFYYKFDVHSVTWITSTFFNGLARTAVPLFIMIGGAIYLKEDKQIPLKKIFFSILRFVVVFLIWDFLYLCYDYKISTNYSNIIIVLTSMLSYKYHLWYLLDYIVLLVFVPILRLICKKENRKQVKYLIILFVICNCFIAMLKEIIFLFDNTTLIVKGLRYIFKLIELFNVGKMTNLMIIFISGWYFSTFDFANYLKKISIIKWMVGIVVPTITILFCVVFSNKDIFGLICNYYYFPNYILTVCIFLTFRYSKTANKQNKIFDYVEKVSFTIYLVHVFVLDKIFELGQSLFVSYINTSWIILIIPFYILITYLISLLLAGLINLLPSKLKKWIC